LIFNTVISVFDSSAKFPNGLLIGKHYVLGSFDECLSVRAAVSPVGKLSNRTFIGKYCLTTFKISTRKEDAATNDSIARLKVSLFEFLHESINRAAGFH
jgi:hypothetical protein